jgi:serine/threonine protein kinase
MELTVANVMGLLLRSRLLPRDEAKALFGRWQAEAGADADDAARFAAWMVEGGHVTPYQAAMLARGHADGFFLGEYKILDRLGQGHMAGVYKAQHRLGQIVAVKVLPPSKAREGNFLHRFRREARLIRRLQHPNVVRAFQVGEHAGLHYLVLEYLEGETLDELLTRRGRLPPDEAVRLVYQALHGLQHIHEAGLVHRDLKPTNLMVVYGPGGRRDETSTATVKILDLGLGRQLFDESQPPGLDPSLTGEGVVLGTPDYMAPEQARNARGADVRADVYSLGCVLYHALTGRPPFPDKNILNQMVRHATETAQPLRELNPAVPDGLQQIVNWMLAKDPAKRYPTPLRAAQALGVFLAAGADVPHETPVNPELKSYLTWLDAVDGSDTAPPTSGRERRSGKDRRRPGPRTPAEVPSVPIVPEPTFWYKVRLNRREAIIFAVGAAAGAFAAFLGCVLALRGRSERPTAEGDH